MEGLKDILRFLKARKKMWLMPLVLALLVIAILVIAGAGSAFAPFVYSLF